MALSKINMYFLVDYEKHILYRSIHTKKYTYIHIHTYTYMYIFTCKHIYIHINYYRPILSIREITFMYRRSL